jgi:hypothetical protein
MLSTSLTDPWISIGIEVLEVTLKSIQILTEILSQALII